MFMIAKGIGCESGAKMAHVMLTAGTAEQMRAAELSELALPDVAARMDALVAMDVLRALTSVIGVALLFVLCTLVKKELRQYLRRKRA